MGKENSLFKTGKPNPRLAKAISIKSPSDFRESIKKLKKNGVTTKEKRALVLARNRAAAQLKRENLSSKEKKQFKKIKNTELPKISKNKSSLKNFGYS